MAAERRTAPRVELNSDAVVYMGGEQIPCRTINVAVGGMALASPVRRTVGSAIKVDFLLPEGGWRSAGATLVRDARYYGSFVWGIQFDELDRQTEILVERYVGRHLVA